MRYFERGMCSFTNRTIETNDRSSVQILLAKLDQNGRAVNDEVVIVNAAGCIRKSGEMDSYLTEYARLN